VVHYPEGLVTPPFTEPELSLFHFANNTWTPIPSQVDTWEHTIQALIPGNGPVMIGAIPNSNSAARVSVAASDLALGSTASIEVRGLSGDLIGVVASTALDFVPFLPAAPILLSLPNSVTLAIGPVPPSGDMPVPLFVPPDPALVGFAVYFQGFAMSPGFNLDLSSPVSRTVQ
jgi:hypothetical protein